MRRKVYDQLKKWKEEQNGESAVLINGARRVGKSYIVKEFAQKEYKSYILLDFNKIGKDIKSLFETYLDDLDTFFMYLSSFTNTPLYPRESVIIFDEVQLYPRARTAIKYLVEDGRYDYIETGSLVSIKKNVEDIMIPSALQEKFITQCLIGIPFGKDGTADGFADRSRCHLTFFVSSHSVAEDKQTVIGR